MFARVGLHGPPPRCWTTVITGGSWCSPLGITALWCYGRWAVRTPRSELLRRLLSLSVAGLCVYSWWAAVFGGPLGRPAAGHLAVSRCLLGISRCSEWVFVVAHMQEPMGIPAASARSGDSHGLDRERQFDRWRNFDWWFSSWMSWSEFAVATRLRGFCWEHPESESEQIDVGHSGDCRCLQWTWSWSIFFYGCWNGSTPHDWSDVRNDLLLWLDIHIWALSFIWPMGRRGVSMYARLGAETVGRMCPSLQMCKGESQREWLDGVKDGTEIRPRLMWKKERAWECFTWSGTPVVASHFYMLSCTPVCHSSGHSANESFSVFGLETRLWRSATTNSADTELIMSFGPSPPKPLARI